MKNKFTCIVADPPFAFSDHLKMSDVKRGAQANYNTMTISKIKEMPVKDLCHPDGAILCLWVPSSLLQEGLDVMKVWGFAHKQTYIWVKCKIDPLKEIRKVFFDFWKNNVKPLKKFTDKSFKQTIKDTATMVNILDYNKGKEFIQNTLAFGMGRLFRNCHEICLIGTSNNKIYKQLQNKSQRTVCFSENMKHSAKPEALQDSLEIMFPNCNYLEIFGRKLRKNWTVVGNESPSTVGEDIFKSLNNLK